MLDFITDFISNNTQMVIVAVISLVVMVGMYIFRPHMFKKTDEQSFQVPGMDMDMHMNMGMNMDGDMNGDMNMDGGMNGNMNGGMGNHPQMETPMDNNMCNMDTGVCQSHQEMEQQQMLSDNEMTSKL